MKSPDGRRGREGIREHIMDIIRGSVRDFCIGNTFVLISIKEHFWKEATSDIGPSVVWHGWNVAGPESNDNSS